MNEQMRKAGLKMSLLMAVTMSLCLSIVNNLASGSLNPILIFLSFAVGFIVSLLIGILVPMPRISSSIVAKYGPGIKAHLLDSLVSDLIYTPFITILVVFLVRVYIGIASGGHAQLPPYPIMCLRSLGLSLVVAYVVILVVSPIFKRLLFKGMPEHH